ANWRALPPQITAPAGRSPDRTSVRGTATTPPPFVPVGSFGDTRPTVGSTPSDASLQAPARAVVPPPPVPPLPIPSGPAVEPRWRARSFGAPEDPSENRVQVLEVIGQVETGLELGLCNQPGHFRVGLQQ